MAKYLDLDGLAYYKSKEDLLLANKVDKETGKGLSTNDYTTNEKTKLSGIETNAEVNILEEIKLNGSTITPINKIVNIEINVPTSTNELTNDSGFITNTVNNLTNYYTKTNTYTKSEIDSLIGSVSSLDIQIVQTLPTQDISTSTIYLVPKTASTNDNYDEYIYVNNSWEHIGSTEVDLSNYYTKTQTDNLLDDKADSSDIPTKVSDLTNDVGYSTFSGSYNDLTNKPTIPTKTSDLTNDSGFVDNTYHDSSKQDTLVSGTNIKTINNTSLLGSGNISISGGISNLEDGTETGSLQQIGNNEASGSYSFAIGYNSTARDDYSHAEGNDTLANAVAAHAEGISTMANGDYSHAEGNGAVAGGEGSHVEGYHTMAGSDYQHISGKYNIVDAHDVYAQIVGNGTSHVNRSNAYTLDWDGNGIFAGSLTMNGNQPVATTSDIATKLDTSKVKSASSTTAGDVYDVTYINTMLGDVESLLGGI